MDERWLADDDWRSSWGALCSRVFSERPIQAWPFRSDRWRAAVLGGGLRLDAKHSSAVRAAAEGAGDSTLLVTVREARGGMLVPLSWLDEELFFRLPGSVSNSVEVRLTGSQGEWGLVCHWEGVALFGSGSGYRVFEDAAGGADALGEAWGDWESSVGHGPQGKEFRTQLLESLERSDK